METGIFEEAYKETPPWDIGEPQSELVHLVENDELDRSVLDVGCGTGENVLYLAGLGYEVWGVDIIPVAIEKAVDKAERRGPTATFLVWDALKLDALGRRFDSVIDSGFFHTLSDDERMVFASSLAASLNVGGTYFMLCFNEHEPGTWGPRRVTQGEIRETFNSGWQINYIKQTMFKTNLGPQCCNAWLSSIALLDRNMAQEGSSQGRLLV